MRGYRKYKNKPVSVDNFDFPSVHEAQRYKELKLRLKAGEIENLRLQVPYELIPKQVEVKERYHKKTGKRIKDEIKVLERPCVYIADFVYFDKKTGQWVVEDAKGYKKGTAYDVFSIKRKLMLQVHGIRVHEV